MLSAVEKGNVNTGSSLNVVAQSVILFPDDDAIDVDFRSDENIKKAVDLTVKKVPVPLVQRL